MNKFDRYTCKYLVFASPFVLLLILWSAVIAPEQIAANSSELRRITGDTLAIVFLIWILGMFYLLLKMVFSKSFRDLILGKFAGIRERDEREAIIVGEASKISFLSTMAFLILLLFFSMFKVTVAKRIDPNITTDRKGYVAIKTNFSVMGEGRTVTEDDRNEIRYFRYTGLPLSPTVILLLIFMWQLGSYKYAIRKQHLDDQ